MVKARTTQLDYYDLLQVGSDASPEEIEGAYRRLQTMYDPERLRGGPAEFEEMARQKRADLDAAYGVLSDPAQRAAYDRLQHGEIQGPTPELDYRPLTPARGQERPASTAPDESRAPSDREVRRAGAHGWLPAALIFSGGLAMLLLLILSSVRVNAGPGALATPTVAGVQLPFTQNQIEQFRAAAETSDTAETWRAYGNALFNNLQTLRENAPQSPQYQGVLDQWLEVTRAYERSLAWQEDETVRSDRAFALLSYGNAANDEGRRQEAFAEAEQAVQQGVSQPRALINYGLILLATEPPQIETATAMWQQVLDESPDAPEAARAQALLQIYGQQDDTER